MIVAVTTRWRQMWPHFEVGSGISDDGSPWVAITSVDGHTIVHIAKEAHDGPTPYVALYNNRTCHAKDLAGLLGWIAANQPDVLTIVRGEDDLQTWQNALLVG